MKTILLFLLSCTVPLLGAPDPAMPVAENRVYRCPMHPAVISDKPGTCPLDKRNFVLVTVSLYWTCVDTLDASLNAKVAMTCASLRSYGDSSNLISQGTIG